MKKTSGDPRKRQVMKNAEQERSSLLLRQKNLLLSTQEIWKAEVLRLLDLFEEQFPESTGYSYDPKLYLIAFGAIAMHRAGCELSDEPEKYKPSEQLESLQVAPAMKDEIEEFLIRNRLEKPETYYIFKSDTSTAV